MTDNQANLISLIREFSQSPIAFHRAYVRIGGSVAAGLFLSQAMYWTPRTSDEDGWFYKNQAEWEEETGLTRREQETARKHLKKNNLVEEKRIGQPARLWYRVRLDVLAKLLTASDGNSSFQYGGMRQTSMAECAKQEWRNAPNSYYRDYNKDYNREHTHRRAARRSE